MRKKQKSLRSKVFFNASVVLAGLKSPGGGSGKLLYWSKQKKIKGLISEVVFDEVVRHAGKVGVSKGVLERSVQKIVKIYPAPPKELKKYRQIAIDYGDIHLFTSAEQLGADYLVSLDKRHVLVLAEKVKKYKIVSPGELIRIIESG